MLISPQMGKEGRKIDQKSEAPRPCLSAGRPRAGLPGKVISFYIVPLDPAYPAIGGTGHLPVNI